MPASFFIWRQGPVFVQRFGVLSYDCACLVLSSLVLVLFPSWCADDPLDEADPF